MTGRVGEGLAHIALQIDRPEIDLDLGSCDRFIRPLEPHGARHLISRIFLLGNDLVPWCRGGLLPTSGSHGGRIEHGGDPLRPGQPTPCAENAQEQCKLRDGIDLRQEHGAQDLLCEDHGCRRGARGRPLEVGEPKRDLDRALIQPARDTQWDRFRQERRLRANAADGARPRCTSRPRSRSRPRMSRLCTVRTGHPSRIAACS